MPATDLELKKNLRTLLKDAALSDALQASKTKRGAIGLLMKAATAQGIALSADELDAFIGNETPPRASALGDLSHQQLVWIAGRALRAGCPKSYVGHTNSCAHCIRTCI